MLQRLLLILVLLVSLTACSPNVETAIEGTWIGETLEQDFRFYQDGRVELKDRKYSVYEGTYTINDGNILTCEFASFVFTAPVVRTARIRGDKLILTDKNGYEEVYLRQE